MRPLVTLWICQLSILISSGSNLRSLRNFVPLKYFSWPKNPDYLGESQCHTRRWTDLFCQSRRVKKWCDSHHVRCWKQWKWRGRSNTTYTSSSNTVKAASEVESENELWALWIFISSGSNLRGLRNILPLNNTSEIEYFSWPKNPDYLCESQWFRQFSEYHIDRLEIVDFLQRKSFFSSPFKTKGRKYACPWGPLYGGLLSWGDWLPYNLVPRAFPLKVGGKSPGNEVDSHIQINYKGQVCLSRFGAS